MLLCLVIYFDFESYTICYCGKAMKKKVLRAKRFQKPVNQHNFLFLTFCCQNYSKKKLKNLDFFLLASLAIFHSNFCPKKTS